MALGGRGGPNTRWIAGSERIVAIDRVGDVVSGAMVTQRWPGAAEKLISLLRYSTVTLRLG